jgi:hypothetical protein
MKKKKARMSKSQVKETIILFPDINGVIMIEWAHEGQTVNQNYYLEVLIKLRERAWKRRQELWDKKSRILHQDNAPAHNALVVKEFLADKSIAMPQPDLAPLTFTCSPK